MLRIFSSINGQVEQIEKPENGSWLCLSEPTDVELATVASQTGIDLADLRAPLDDEERSRVDVEDDYTMIIVDIPTVEERGGRDWYETIPLSIIVTENLIITVCMQDTPVLHPFMEGTIRGFNTFMRSRFILQILLSDELPMYPLFHRKLSTAVKKNVFSSYTPIGTTGLYFLNSKLNG